MKKILFVLIFFSYLYIANSALAHFVLNDHNVGALVHIDPDDAPLVGETAHIHLNFQDKTQTLTNTNCECSLELVSNGITLVTVPITELQGSDHSFMTDFIFPAKGIYTLNVDGTVRGSNSTSFHMTYDLRVDREKSSGATSVDQTNNNEFPAVGIVLALMIIAVIFFLKRTRT